MTAQMTASVVFATLNVLASLIIASIVVWKLASKPDSFTPAERYGMGLAAAGAVLTIGPVTFDGSPFDDWSGVLLRLGMAVYFVGRLTRHRYNNWRARRDADKRLRG